ncbi:hypothetical protein EFJ98_24665 [Pseudomonas putida]|nr:hypothetical protein EFJ98_24665 [Pseudomonas putida]
MAFSMHAPPSVAGRHDEIGIGIATIKQAAHSGDTDMLPGDHHLMLIAIAVVLAVDAVALAYYLRHKP